MKFPIFYTLQSVIYVTSPLLFPPNIKYAGANIVVLVSLVLASLKLVAFSKTLLVRNPIHVSLR